MLIAFSSKRNIYSTRMHKQKQIKIYEIIYRIYEEALATYFRNLKSVERKKIKCRRKWAEEKRNDIYQDK